MKIFNWIYSYSNYSYSNYSYSNYSYANKGFNFLNPFLASVPILYPLKIPENLPKN